MSVDHADLSGFTLLHEAARDRARAFLAEARALVAVAGRSASVLQVTIDGREIGIEDTVAELVATRLHRSPLAVRRQIADARRLVCDLPRTVAALDAGSISPEHAHAIVHTADDLDGSMLRVYEARVVEQAAARTPGETATYARRLRASLDRTGEEQRRQRARRHIDVRMWAEDDGLACLQARMPIADAARVHAALDLRSREVELLCDASMGERRVSALVQSVCGDSPAASNSGVEVQVIVDLATLLDLTDEPGLVGTPHGSAEPITADAVRDLLADDAIPMSFRRLVLDPMSGELLDRGRRVYRPSTSLRAFLVARDGTCRFPGCGRTAHRCEIDHADAWDRGGKTDRANLGPLCVRHHLMKTHADWQIVGHGADGSTKWRGPDSQTYVFHPRDYGPTRVLRPADDEKRKVQRFALPPPTTGDPPF